MYASFRRRVSTVLPTLKGKASTYGLSAVVSARQVVAPTTVPRPMHRQFATFVTNTHLRTRSRYGVQPLNVRRVHIRALSYSSIPRFVLRAFRVPVGAATVGAGGFTYANYKFEGEYCRIYRAGSCKSYAYRVLFGVLMRVC